MHRFILSLFLILTVPALTCYAEPQLTTSILPAQTILAPNPQTQNIQQLKPIIIHAKAPEKTPLQALPQTQNKQRYQNFLNYAGQNEPVAYKKIALVKVNNTRKKQAFMFIFFMNKPKPEAEQQKINPARKYMHIMWTGTKKLMPAQKNYENKYPIDVSIDNYSDGFVPGRWNLALPDKKPREVSVSFLWAF